nr:uncharacterized protein LOC127339437 [Lolium perenne]
MQSSTTTSPAVGIFFKLRLLRPTSGALNHEFMLLVFVAVVASVVPGPFSARRRSAAPRRVPGAILVIPVHSKTMSPSPTRTVCHSPELHRVHLQRGVHLILFNINTVTRLVVPPRQPQPSQCSSWIQSASHGPASQPLWLGPSLVSISEIQIYLETLQIASYNPSIQPAVHV